MYCIHKQNDLSEHSLYCIHKQNDLSEHICTVFTNKMTLVNTVCTVFTNKMTFSEHRLYCIHNQNYPHDERNSSNQILARKIDTISLLVCVHVSSVVFINSHVTEYTFTHSLTLSQRKHSLTFNSKMG